MRKVPGGAKSEEGWTANILAVPVVDAGHSSPITYGWIINSPDLTLHSLLLDEVKSYLRIARHSTGRVFRESMGTNKNPNEARGGKKQG